MQMTLKKLTSKQTLFLKGTNSLCAQLHGDFFAINNNSLGLKVWLPDFFSMTLRKAYVIAVLLSFAG